MEKLFKLKKQSYSFDKKGFILKPHIVCDDFIKVRADDLCLLNMKNMSEEDVESCLFVGNDFSWCYTNDKIEEIKKFTCNDLLLKLRESKDNFMLNFNIFGRSYFTSLDTIDNFIKHLKLGILDGVDSCIDIYNNINNEIEFNINKYGVVYIRIKG